MLDDIRRATQAVKDAPPFAIEPRYAPPAIPIIESPHLPDDQVIFSSDGTGAPMVILVGTQPPDPIKQAGRDARLLVRRGLADVLEWLGQPVINEPAMARLRATAKAPKPIWMP